MAMADKASFLLFHAASSLTFRGTDFSFGNHQRIPFITNQRLDNVKAEASPARKPGLESFEEAPVSSSASSASSSSSESLVSERGIRFSTESSFFRAESSLGRDLAVLAAALYKRSQGRLRVLDAMSGCGVRALRYLVQADADFVLVNDCNPELHSTIVDNMSRYMPLQGLHSPPSKPFRKLSSSERPKSGTGYVGNDENGSDTSGYRASCIKSNGFSPVFPCETQPDIKSQSFSVNNIRWQVCHEEAGRLLGKCHLNYDFYDFIDVDSFGSDSHFLGPALSAVQFGGLLFVTCTDGFSSAGHRPYNSLAQYGTFMRHLPYANELGLRMLTGAVVKEASLRNMTVSPIFSVYASHGPVFRVLLRTSSGKPEKIRHYGFIYHCSMCGGSGTVAWENLGSTCCPCSEKRSDSMKMSGPLWTGPLHNADDLQDIIDLALEWGWISNLNEHELANSLGRGRSKRKQDKLRDLLYIMLEESHPDLPFGYIKLDELGKRGKIQSPRRDTLIKALQNEGYVASRSQVCSNAVKTNCSVASCIALAQRLAGSEGC